MRTAVSQEKDTLFRVFKEETPIPSLFAFKDRWRKLEPMSVDEMTRVLKAYKMGEAIEWTTAYSEEGEYRWYPMSRPVWNFEDYRYRVKGENR